LPTRSLTVAAVERLKPPAAGQLDYFDKGFPGLALRVGYGGSKTWVYFHRLHGKLRRHTLGRFPAMELAAARDAWREARKLVDKGESPAHRRPPEADAFGNVAAEWLKRDQGENRSAAAVGSILARHVLPDWRDRMIGTITRRDASELIDRVADRVGTTMARRLQAHLHRLFRWSVGRSIIEINPMADLPKPGKEVKRDRVLERAEIAAVWKASDAIGWPFGPLFKLLLFSGARREEIGALQWSEIVGDEIRLSGARTKNGEAHVIPLAPEATALIKTLPRIADSHFVFTTTGETSVSGWSRAKRLLDAAAAQANGGAALAPWRPHDLRRTVATHLQRPPISASLQVIEAILGHLSGSRAGIVGVYQRHTFDAEKRTVLEAWAGEIVRLINAPLAAANVVALSRKKARL
jgi:integrase